MKVSAFLPLLFLLVSCATPEPQLNYIGPTATLSDYIEQESASRAQVFAVLEIDGQKVPSSISRTRAATRGQGFRSDGRIVSRDVPARRVELKIVAQTIVAAEILALFGKKFHVEGKVSFDARPGGSYMVKGVLRAAECAIWIEDLTSRQIVSDIIVLKPDSGKAAR